MDVFLIKDDKLLEKYSTISDKVNADTKTNLTASLFIIKKNLKTKRKSHGDEVTDFFDKEIPKFDSNHACLAVISLDSALNKDGSYHPQVNVGTECRYIEKKIIRHINDNLNDFSYSDESGEE